MAKHHPDLIFCRKQPGVGKSNVFILHYFNLTFCNNNKSTLSNVSAPKYICLIDKIVVFLQPLVVYVRNVTENV